MSPFLWTEGQPIIDTSGAVLKNGAKLCKRLQRSFLKIWTIKQLAQEEMYYIKLNYRKKMSYQGELDIFHGPWRLRFIGTEVECVLCVVVLESMCFEHLEQNNGCLQGTFHFYYFKWRLSAKHKTQMLIYFQIGPLSTSTSLLYKTTHASI